MLFRSSEGDITIDLFDDKTPNTVANFLGLATRGHCLVGSLTGVVASKSVTEASKGALTPIGNRR